MTLWHLFDFFKDSNLCIQHADFASLGFGRWLDWLASPVSDSHHDRVLLGPIHLQQQIKPSRPERSRSWSWGMRTYRWPSIPLALPGHFSSLFQRGFILTCRVSWIFGKRKGVQFTARHQVADGVQDIPSIPLGQEASGLASDRISTIISTFSQCSFGMKNRLITRKAQKFSFQSWGEPRNLVSRQVVTALLLAILEVSQLHDATLTSLQMFHPGGIIYI